MSSSLNEIPLSVVFRVHPVRKETLWRLRAWIILCIPSARSLQRLNAVLCLLVIVSCNNPITLLLNEHLFHIFSDTNGENVTKI